MTSKTDAARGGLGLVQGTALYIAAVLGWANYYAPILSITRLDD